MNNQDQLNLTLQTVCLMQQNQMLKQQNVMLRDLMDHMDAVGDRLWRMDRRLTTPLVAEVLVDGAEHRLIRRRQTVEELLSLELGL